MKILSGSDAEKEIRLINMHISVNAIIFHPDLDPQEPLIPLLLGDHIDIDLEKSFNFAQSYPSMFRKYKGRDQFCPLEK